MVSQPTVKFHVSSILNKLPVSSRAEAAAKALQENLLPDGPQNILDLLFYPYLRVIDYIIDKSH